MQTSDEIRLVRNVSCAGMAVNILVAALKKTGALKA